MDARIILAGQPVDVAGALGAGNQLAAQTNQLRDQNALRDVYRTQGAGIMAGDQRSLNALAAIDPITAQTAQSNVLQNRTATRQLEILNAQELRQIEAAKAQMTAAEAAAAAARIEDAVKASLAAQTPEQFDQIVTQFGAPELVGQFAMREAYASKAMSMAEAFKANAPPEALEWRDATPEEAARYNATAGQISTKTGAFKPFNAPRNTTTEVGPDGTLRIIQGSGSGNKLDVGDTISPAGIDEAKNLISDILKTDNNVMARITGSIMGGGGNDVEQLSMFQRAYYGEDGLATIERLGQLGSQAWFAARDMLKGGGQITDYESKKAEAAVARLSRTKDPAELKSALQELLDAINVGEEKLRKAGRLGVAEAPAGAAADIPPGAIDLLKQNDTPEYRRSFDEIFGPGSAAQVLGGN
jgi:hypothetical protein